MAQHQEEIKLKDISECYECKEKTLTFSKHPLFPSQQKLQKMICRKCLNKIQIVDAQAFRLHYILGFLARL